MKSGQIQIRGFLIGHLSLSLSSPSVLILCNIHLATGKNMFSSMIHFISDTPAFLFAREELKGFLFKVKGVPDHVNLFPCVIDVLGHHTVMVVADGATKSAIAPRTESSVCLYVYLEAMLVYICVFIYTYESQQYIHNIRICICMYTHSCRYIRVTVI